LFRRFMYGRYGNDQFNNFILICALIAGLLTIFLRGVAYVAFSMLQMLLLVLWALRAFSKNHFARRKENTSFLALRNRVKPWFNSVSAFFKRLADRNHKYFKCPNCKSRLRVPRGRGNITVTCPRCKNRFDKKS